ncbi:hypothetical protein JHK87_046733 [Glycine soja]|nr:hypothetical protein JHK87_046733 [Glycine soja]
MSLCEKSMQVVVNVIRFSSFSIAQKTLGATSTTKAGPGSDMDPDEEPLVAVPDQFPAASKRSQQPQSRANPTYVIKSAGSIGSTEHLIYQERVPGDVNPKKEQCVDGLASDYITKRNDVAVSDETQLNFSLMLSLIFLAGWTSITCRLVYIGDVFQHEFA